MISITILIISSLAQLAILITVIVYSHRKTKRNEKIITAFVDYSAALTRVLKTSIAHPDDLSPDDVKKIFALED